MGSVFDLLGAQEPALTGALGFALARSRRLLEAFTADAFGGPQHAVSIAVERHGEDTADRTDIEILGDDGPLLIVEAKRGWVVPTTGQLETYARRRPRLLLVISDCTNHYAAAMDLPLVVGGVDVVHRSWRDVIKVVQSVPRSDRWAGELLTYLESTVATWHTTESNLVYVVSVGPIPEFGGKHGRDFVDQDVYVHPHAPGWPQHPPTYLGFRQDNAVFTIRHVDDVDVVADVRDVAEEFGIPTISEEVTGPQVVYRLGPHIGPADPLPSGMNYRAARHRVHLDLLLTSATYKEALARSKERLQGQLG